MASAEVAPFAKVGGLADVVGSLPPALLKHNCQVKIIMPKYGCIDEKKYKLKPHKNRIKIWSAEQTYYVNLWKTFLPGSKVEVFFVDHKENFGHERVYHGNNSERFLFFSLAVLECLPYIDMDPDVIHCHDFHTAMIPDIIKVNPDIWGDIKTLYTIHNLNYQGKSETEVLSTANLKKSSLASLTRDAQDGDINFMVQGIVNADKVNTVSPTYAKEIATSVYGAGLEKVIKQYQQKITGILNGIDTERFNPETDPDIKYNYNSKFLNRKSKNKLHLQKEFNLEITDDKPLIGLITRLCWQKGLDLITKDLVQNVDAQFLFLGTGDKIYEEQLRSLARDFPRKVWAEINFDAVLAQEIYAGCDIFLMPSRFEPCGLGQMIAMRYGTVPVVRYTGGLADTVDKQVGFYFNKLEETHLTNALNRTVELFQSDVKRWQQLQKNCMTRDFSWNRSAKKYLEVYNNVISAV